MEVKLLLDCQPEDSGVPFCLGFLNEDVRMTASESHQYLMIVDFISGSVS